MQDTQTTKTVIITGAGSGIGLAIARRLSAAGYNTVLSGRDEDKLMRAANSLHAGERVATLVADIAQARTGQALVALAEERFGAAHVLVNNAGIFSMRPFLQCDSAYLDSFWATNLKGTFFATQAAVPALRRAGGGAIISIGSVLVDQAKVGMPVSAAMAAKGAIHALMVSLAAELAPDRIRVNTVAPGIVRTPLIGPDADQLASLHPLGRIAEPDEVARAVQYLAEAEFITGCVLPVDGGYSHGR